MSKITDVFIPSFLYRLFLYRHFLPTFLYRLLLPTFLPTFFILNFSSYIFMPIFYTDFFIQTFFTDFFIATFFSECFTTSLPTFHTELFIPNFFIPIFFTEIFVPNCLYRLFLPTFFLPIRLSIEYLIGEKIRRGKVTKLWFVDENFTRGIIFPEEFSPDKLFIFESRMIWLIDKRFSSKNKPRLGCDYQTEAGSWLPNRGWVVTTKYKFWKKAFCGILLSSDTPINTRTYAHKHKNIRP